MPRQHTSSDSLQKVFYIFSKERDSQFFFNKTGEAIFVYCWLKYVYERIFYCVYRDDEKEGSVVEKEEKRDNNKNEKIGQLALFQD